MAEYASANGSARAPDFAWSETQAHFLYLQALHLSGETMDTRHQKDAMSTDHKTRTDDEHIHEQDKQQLRQSEKDEKNTGLIPKQAERFVPGNKE